MTEAIWRAEVSGVVVSGRAAAITSAACSVWRRSRRLSLWLFSTHEVHDTAAVITSPSRKTAMITPDGRGADAHVAHLGVIRIGRSHRRDWNGADQLFLHD